MSSNSLDEALPKPTEADFDNVIVRELKDISESDYAAFKQIHYVESQINACFSENCNVRPSAVAGYISKTIHDFNKNSNSKSSRVVVNEKAQLKLTPQRISTYMIAFTRLNKSLKNNTSRSSMVNKVLNQYELFFLKYFSVEFFNTNNPNIDFALPCEVSQQSGGGMTGNVIKIPKSHAWVHGVVIAILGGFGVFPAVLYSSALGSYKMLQFADYRKKFVANFARAAAVHNIFQISGAPDNYQEYQKMCTRQYVLFIKPFMDIIGNPVKHYHFDGVINIITKSISVIRKSKDVGVDKEKLKELELEVKSDVETETQIVRLNTGFFSYLAKEFTDLVPIKFDTIKFSYIIALDIVVRYLRESPGNSAIIGFWLQSLSYVVSRLYADDPEGLKQDLVVSVKDQPKVVSQYFEYLKSKSNINDQRFHEVTNQILEPFTHKKQPGNQNIVKESLDYLHPSIILATRGGTVLRSMTLQQSGVILPGMQNYGNDLPFDSINLDGIDWSQITEAIVSILSTGAELLAEVGSAAISVLSHTHTSGGGKKSYRRSNKQVDIGGRTRVVYLGEHNKHYVRIKNTMTTLSDARKMFKR